jgi:hypothetical protein
LAADGLGAVLNKTRQAALAWVRLIEEAEALRLVTPPPLDIVNFYAVTESRNAASISALTHRVFEALMNDQQHPLYLAKLNLTPRLLTEHRDLVWDDKLLTVFRSVLMKPEQLAYVPTLHQRVLSYL